jgi:hypothetical protein
MTSSQWQNYTLAYQMGNIGAEVSRMVSFKTKNDEAHARLAFERMLTLLDLTIADRRWKTGISELIRLREVLCGFMEDSSEFLVSGKDINNYFLPFAILARK